MSYLDNIDSLVTFKKDILKPLLRGASIDSLPWQEGYREMYEKWAAVYGDAIIKMDADDRLLSFTDFIRSENLRKGKAAAEQISNQMLSRKFAKQVSRGQFLCIQDKTGSFDRIITRDQLEKMENPLSYTVSDTCAGVTANWEKICNEQSALLFAEKLREQHFLVQSIEAGPIFKAEIVHPKMGLYTVSVDLEQDLNKMLVFTFINSQGEKREISMNRFGYAYEIIEEKFRDYSIETGTTFLKTGTASLMLNDANLIAAEQAAIAASEAAMAALSVKAAQDEAAISGKVPQETLFSGLVVPNFQAAKANLHARLKEEKSRTKLQKQATAAFEAKENYKSRIDSWRRKDKKTRNRAMIATFAIVFASGTVGTLMSWIITR